MNKLILFKNALLLSAALTVGLVACKKTDDTTNNNNSANVSDEDRGYGADQARLERENNDVIAIADIAAKTGHNNLLKTTEMNELSGCATITHDTVLNLITIDFGNTPCTGIDGKNRSGKILVSYTGQYKDSGSNHSISFDNYVVNGNQITGSKTVSNMGTNNSGAYYYTITVTDTVWMGTVTSNNGFICWNGNRTRTWVSGYNTNTRSDDSYDISGTTTVRRLNGNMFIATITSPLRIAFGCAWISQGTIQFTPQNNTNNSRVLDYGNGNCDSQATLTINGVSYNITL
jgi:hypothetical protein